MDSKCAPFQPLFLLSISHVTCKYFGHHIPPSSSMTEHNYFVQKTKAEAHNSHTMLKHAKDYDKLILIYNRFI